MRQLSLCIIVLPIFGAICLGGQGFSGRVTAREVRTGIARSQARIGAWYVEYEARNVIAGKAEDSYVHRAVAAISPDRFYHWASHGSTQIPWEEDPFQQRLTVTGDQAIVEHPFNREFIKLSTSPDHRLPGTASEEVLLAALGWWSLGDISSPDAVPGAPASLSDVCKSPKYNIFESKDPLSGRECCVLEFPKHDRIRVDPERGFASVERELYDVSSGKLVFRISSAGERCIAAGVWAPSTIRITRFDDVQSVDPRPIGESVINILDIRLNNQVPTKLFVFKPLPGSLQFSDTGSAHQAIGGGTDYFDKTMDWIIRNMKPLGKPAARRALIIEADTEYAIVSLCLIILCTVYARNRRTRRYVDHN